MFISCNNDDDSSAPPVEEANFYALTVGNTWTYEYFERDWSSGEFVTMDVVEEVLITETTEIEGEVFFTFQSTTTGENMTPISPEIGITTINKRDSLGYLINDEHSVLFSNENLNAYLISDNDWGNMYGELKEGFEDVEVEAGAFSTNRNEIYAILSNNGEISPGRDNKYYTEEIGEVYRTFSSVSNPEHSWEKRLISYNIID